MATSLLRPHLVVTASCKVLVSREWAGHRVGRGHAVTGMGGQGLLHSVWHVNTLLLLPKEGEGNSLSQKCLQAHKTEKARPLGRSWEAWGRALLLRPSAQGTGEGKGALR